MSEQEQNGSESKQPPNSLYKVGLICLVLGMIVGAAGTTYAVYPVFTQLSDDESPPDQLVTIDTEKLPADNATTHEEFKRWADDQLAEEDRKHDEAMSDLYRGIAVSLIGSTVVGIGAVLMAIGNPRRSREKMV